MARNQQLIRHTILFIIAFVAFGLSIILALRVADYEINSSFSAIWAIVQIGISVAGILTLPVLMFSLMMRIIGFALQAPCKRKNTSPDTIAR